MTDAITTIRTAFAGDPEGAVEALADILASTSDGVPLCDVPPHTATFYLREAARLLFPNSSTQAGKGLGEARKAGGDQNHIGANRTAAASRQGKTDGNFFFNGVNP